MIFVEHTWTNLKNSLHHFIDNLSIQIYSLAGGQSDLFFVN